MDQQSELVKKVQHFLKNEKATWIIPVIMLAALAIYLLLTQGHKLPFIYSQF